MASKEDKEKLAEILQQFSYRELTRVKTFITEIQDHLYEGAREESRMDRLLAGRVPNPDKVRDIYERLF
jgi:hypothetical protein